ncbi:MAG: alanine--tRNA ligase-related protein, partial [Promethearchaeota archaeon]
LLMIVLLKRKWYFTMAQKLFWERPYETEFEAQIIEIREDAVILSQTLFYPAGGGQLSDRGFLKKENTSFEVIEVNKENDSILHHLKTPFKGKLAIGDTISGHIDWDFRYAIMKAHTSQHVFSATIKRLYGIDTQQAILEPEEVTIHLINKITTDELQNALQTTLSLCLEGREVRSSVLTRQEVQDKYANQLRGIVFDEDPVRLIEIDGWDLMCCGGTHVSKTTEIGPLFLFTFKKGTEIKYYVGSRAFKALSEANVRLLTAANLLNQPVLLIDELVQLRLDELHSLRQKNKELALKTLDLLTQTPGIKIGNTNVKVLELPLDRKLITAGFKHFPSNSLLFIKLSPLMIMILSSSPEVQAHKLLQSFTTQFGGKGGGGPKVAQGSLQKEPEDILSVIKHFLKK